MHANSKMVERKPGHIPHARLPVSAQKPTTTTTTTASAAVSKAVDTVAFSVRRPALVVRGASKKYGKQLVLHNLNMFAKEGTIYALIGAGCSGKTTILECIAGLKKFTKGELLVFGARPGSAASGIPGRRIGFLPQDVALHSEFTITEVLQYYGRMYGMTLEKVKERQELLAKILSLQNCNERLSQLSLSERKRASIAACLVHEPDLVLMDEVTRGLDTLFKRGLWAHLLSGGKSVIITCQNIDEARQAHRVGFLRGGALILEDNPIALLQRHNSPLLEDVIARICYKEKAKESEKENDVGKKKSSGKNGIEEVVLVEDWSAYGMPNGLPPVTDTDVKSISYCDWMDQVSHEEDNLATKKAAPLKKREMEKLPRYPNPSRFPNRIRALIVKQAIITQRNFGYILLRFILTAFLITLFCLAIGPDPKGIRMGLLDNDSDSSDIISECLQNDDFSFSCKPEKMSCRFLRSLPNGLVDWSSLESSEAAENAIKVGSISGYLEFTSMFSSDILNKIVNSVQEDYYSANEDNSSSSLIVHLDLSNTLITRLVKSELSNRYKAFEEEIATDCGGYDRNSLYDSNSTTLMKMEESPLNNITYENMSSHYHSKFVVPAVPLVILFFMMSFTSSLQFQREVREGIHSRSLCSGVNTIEVLAMHWIVELIILAVHVAIVTVIPLFAFRTFVFNGFWVWPVLLYGISGVGGMTLAFMVSAFSHCRVSLISMALIYLMPNLFFSGVLWTVESLMYELQWISYFLPLSLASQSARYMIIGGWDISIPKVWHGFVAISAWTTLHWIIMLLVILSKYLMR